MSLSKEQARIIEQQIMRWNVQLDQTTNGLLNAVGAFPYIIMDAHGKPRIFLNVLEDPVTGMAFGTTNPLHIQIADATTVGNVAGVNFINPSANGTLGSTYCLMVANYPYLYNGINMSLTRTPNTWKSALITAAGSTPIWTSGVGKTARLLGIRITLVNGTTAAAASLLKVLDVAADTGIGVQICGAAMGAVGTSSIIVNESYQNGYLMAATNTAININLSSVLAVAGVFVQVWGTEE